MAISPGDNETVAISDMTYNEIMDMGTLVKEGFLMKNPSRCIRPHLSSAVTAQLTHRLGSSNAGKATSSSASRSSASSSCTRTG